MFDGKSILITGGTGSFGQAFIKHLLTCYKPRRVAEYSRDELKQHDMRQECDGLKAVNMLKFIMAAWPDPKTPTPV
jgi:UDP-N-acetylglucosamine 4,6-dehydratase